MAVAVEVVAVVAVVAVVSAFVVEEIVAVVRCWWDVIVAVAGVTGVAGSM